MKAEHRHELKTNELAEWLTNFPKWAKENLKMIIYVSVVVIVVIAVALFRWYGKNVELAQKELKLTRLINALPQSKLQILRAQARGVDISYTLLTDADNFQAVAKDAKDDQMAALALIKQAQSLRMELHYRLGTVPTEDITTQIERAKAAYTKAIEKSSSNLSLMAMAKFGLGLCEEELGNFDKARQIYNDITASPDFEGTTAAYQAKQRLATMAEFKQKLVFMPAPKKAPAEAAQPQIQLETPDINLPGQ